MDRAESQRRVCIDFQAISISQEEIMKIDGVACALLAALFSIGTVAAQTIPSAPVTLTVNTATHGFAIPTDFNGIGFERGTLNSGNAGASGYIFSPSNTQVVTLFQNLGIKNLRIGGGSVDDEIPVGTGSDGYTGIDNLFRFAQASGIKVLYSFRLLNPHGTITNLVQDDANAGAYIWNNYRASVQSFAIGNEPDFHSYHTSDPLIYETTPGVAGTAFPSYLADWTNFANAIEASSPGALFSGPDSGAGAPAIDYNGVPWTISFANAEEGSQSIADITQHIYVGGSPGSTTTQQAIDNMLSPEWINNPTIGAGPEGSSSYSPYGWFYTNNLAPISQDDFPYRLTESDDYLSGVSGASNGYASALWALDYMQWWAQHGAAGVNFHNKQWIYTDTITPGDLVSGSCSPAPCVNYQTAPKGYGIKAFDLGGHGYVEPIAISNPNGINVTAYAVGEGQDLYVTLINKTHSSTNDEANAALTIQPNGFNAASAAWMALSNGAPGNAATTTGTTLGGAAIANNAPWFGEWTPLNPSTGGGGIALTVPSASAAVVHIRAASNYAGPTEINQNGALDVFALDTGGNVWHDMQLSTDVPASPAEDWSGWTELPGVIAVGGPAVVKNQNATLEVFVPASNGDVWHNWQSSPSGAWNGWVDMGSGSYGIAGLRAADNADGSLSVFGIGANGDVWTARESAPEVGWSAWTDLSGTQIQPGFAVGQDLDGLIEIFGIDGNGQPWQNAQNNSGGWVGWSEMPTDAPAFKNANLLPWFATARNLDGRLAVFAAGSNSHVWLFTQVTPGGAMGEPQDLGGMPTDAGFVAGQNADGTLALFAAQKQGGGNGNSPQVTEVFTMAQLTPGGLWGPWTELGATPLGSDLVVGNTQDGRIQVFGIGGNGDVWSDWQASQPPASPWNGWSDFGNGNGANLCFCQTTAP
jgi:hypothetical protein